MENQNEKIQQMQFLEQNLQAILMQKQAFQMDLSETAAALKEIEKAKDDVYKMIGQLMIKTDKTEMKKELEDKKNLVETRLKTMENQEEALSKDASKLRDEIMKEVEKEKKKE